MTRAGRWRLVTGRPAGRAGDGAAVWGGPVVQWAGGGRPCVGGRWRGRLFGRAGDGAAVGAGRWSNGLVAGRVWADGGGAARSGWLVGGRPCGRRSGTAATSPRCSSVRAAVPGVGRLRGIRGSFRLGAWRRRSWRPCPVSRGRFFPLRAGSTCRQSGSARCRPASLAGLSRGPAIGV
jgi:hypothetical protein